MLAQGAVSFIKQGCAMLHEGRMELEGAKKTVEGVIADVKAIKNIWNWLIGLLSGKPKSKSTEEAPKSLAKAKTASKKQQTYEEMELLLIKDIGERLGLLFDTQQQINNYYRALEEESKTVYDPEQNSSKKAIERTLIELQMEKLLEQVRELLNKPLMINSGFRSKAVNDSVGSKDSSQHRIGCAADLRVPGMTPDEVVKTVMAAGLGYDQIIREFDRWTHISIPNNPEDKPRQQALIIDKMGTRQYA